MSTTSTVLSVFLFFSILWFIPTIVTLIFDLLTCPRGISWREFLGDGSGVFRYKNDNGVIIGESPKSVPVVFIPVVSYAVLALLIGSRLGILFKKMMMSDKMDKFLDSPIKRIK